MALTAEPLHAKPRPQDQMTRLFTDGWPEFIVPTTGRGSDRPAVDVDAVG